MDLLIYCSGLDNLILTLLILSQFDESDFGFSFRFELASWKLETSKIKLCLDRDKSTYLVSADVGVGIDDFKFLELWLPELFDFFISAYGFFISVFIRIIFQVLV